MKLERREILKSAVAVAVDAPDAEFAASLALSAGDLIRALDL